MEKETELLDRIRNGDIDVFEWLYSNFYVALNVYANHFIRDRNVAEEVVQDVFLTLWEQRERIIIKDSLRGYLFASVRNKSLDYLKHLQVVNHYNESFINRLKDAEYLFLLSQESGESTMISEELENIISEAVNSLPDQCRKIFTMSRFENMKHQEIANTLGITLNTVHKQISLALDKLRIKLEKFL
jgi:RNA polymerase sigma-70 factor, ECF subfamily